jgi:hypothetical protein
MDGPGDPGDLDDLADSQWSQAFPWLARTSRTHKLRTLLERAERAHRTSATLMRALGQESGARKAEHFAARVRLQLNEPELARLLPGGAHVFPGRPGGGQTRGAGEGVVGRGGRLDEQADLARRIMARLSASGRTSQPERYRENIAVNEQRAAVLLGLIHELV